MRFFERQEIKDALAYLRLINNRQDDAAFERVINTPTRGIGNRTLDILRNLTRERQITLWQAVQVATQENMLAGRASTALLRFQELINSLQLDTAEMPLFAQTDFVIKHSGLYEMYQQEKKAKKGEVRIENLEELVTATREFIKPDNAEEMTELTAFFNARFLRSWRRTSLAASILCRNDDVALCERLRISSCIYGGRRRRIIPKFSFF